MRLEAGSELLAPLRATPRRVEELLRGLTRSQLTTSPAPGKWSVLEILCHCRDAEIEIYRPVYAALVNTPPAAQLANDHPTLATVDPDLRALIGLYRNEKPAAALKAWKKERQQTILLAEGLAASATKDNVLALVERHTAHDRTHLQQIESILERQATFARLAATPRELRERFETLALAAPSGAPGAGSTALFREASRLRDFEHLMLARYVLILEQEHPQLRPFDATPLDARRGGASVGSLLREFEARREETLALLQALGSKLWQRRGAHPRRGDLTIAELIAQHLDHDAERLGALRAEPLPRIRLGNS